MERSVLKQELDFKVSARDWLTNAAIMGYLRIQERRGKSVELSDESLRITSDDLEGFADAYFTYSLEQYEFLPRLSKAVFGRVEKATNPSFSVQFKASIARARVEMMRAKLDFSDFNANLQLVRERCKAFTRRILDELGKFGRNAKTQRIRADIKKNNDEFARSFGPDAKFLVNLLKRFYFNKKIVGNFMLQSGSRKEAFEKEYVQAAQSYLRSPPDEGLMCRVCLRMKVPFSALGQTKGAKLPMFGEGNFSPIAVSLDTFPNFFYNLVSNVILCPVCELLLLCAWAGFTKIPFQFGSAEALRLKSDDYIFVNTISLLEMRDQNTAIAKLYERGAIASDNTIYEEVMHNLFIKEKVQKAKWILEHVFFVELTPSTRKDAHRSDFRYFAVGKDIASLFRDPIAIRSFKSISGNIEVAKDKRVNLRRHVLKKILERNSTDFDCFKLLVDHIKNPASSRPSSIFNIVLLQCILSDIRRKERGPILDSKQIYGILKHWEQYGYDFADVPLEKRQRISYKLLSAVRSGRREDFVDYLMKLYIGKDLAVPSDLHFIADDDERFTFERKAYAFLTGFLSKNKTSSEKILDRSATSGEG